jgi:OOP family OmpA-OmpF porin
MSSRALVLAALLCLTGCRSGPQLRAVAAVVKEDIERARRSNAMRCAPRELATAEAHLDFTLGELEQGSAGRAAEHLDVAEVAAKRAVAASRDCAPRQVVVKEPPKVVVKLEATDGDGDGVLDVDDRCPAVAGPPENKGCPVEAPKDVDGDGVFEPADACPTQPEDLDGYQDADGCPELDNDGDGILDQADKCPNEAGPLPSLGCPVTDKDEDGLADDVDQCVNEPEDKDGFRDEDGCPDLDNDADGVPDDRDECPLKPGPSDNKGCPRQYSLVVVTQEKIEIKKQIRFATGSAQIVGADSAKILDEVAQALADSPQIKRLRVEGHTDSVGDDSKNLKLSAARATAVLGALTKRGVAAARLEAAGFGETRPLASNATAAGRAENRRTEFNIVEQ